MRRISDSRICAWKKYISIYLRMCFSDPLSHASGLSSRDLSQFARTPTIVATHSSSSSPFLFIFHVYLFINPFFSFSFRLPSSRTLFTEITTLNIFGIVKFRNENRQNSMKMANVRWFLILQFRIIWRKKSTFAWCKWKCTKKRKCQCSSMNWIIIRAKEWEIDEKETKWHEQVRPFVISLANIWLNIN